MFVSASAAMKEVSADEVAGRRVVDWTVCFQGSFFEERVRIWLSEGRVPTVTEVYSPSTSRWMTP